MWGVCVYEKRERDWDQFSLRWHTTCTWTCESSRVPKWGNENWDDTMVILKRFAMNNVFLLIGVDQSLGTGAVTSKQFCPVGHSNLFCSFLVLS